MPPVCMKVKTSEFVSLPIRFPTFEKFTLILVAGSATASVSVIFPVSVSVIFQLVAIADDEIVFTPALPSITTSPARFGLVKLKLSILEPPVNTVKPLKSIELTVPSRSFVIAQS